MVKSNVRNIGVIFWENGFLNCLFCHNRYLYINNKIMTEKINVLISDNSKYNTEQYSNLLQNNPLVEFTILLYDGNNDTLIYTNNFKGRLQDERIANALANIEIPESIRSGLSLIGVYLDLVAYAPNRQKIQYAPIMDPDRNPLTNFFSKNIFDYPNKYEFDMNETVTTLTLNPIVESTMLTICGDDGFDLNSRTFENNDQYLNDIAKINNYILLNQLELNKYKQQSAKILKNGIGISDYEDGESIQKLNNALGVLNESSDRYIKLSKNVTLTNIEKTKADLVIQLKKSLKAYIDILES